MANSGRRVVRQIPQAVERNDPKAAGKLLPVVQSKIQRLARPLREVQSP
jgi:hypothetical protein